jgi:hypothetical protein
VVFSDPAPANSEDPHKKSTFSMQHDNISVKKWIFAYVVLCPMLDLGDFMGS